MSFKYEIDCAECNETNDIASTVCSHCGLPIPGTLNVKRARLKAEVDALEKRYKEAITKIDSKGAIEELNLLRNEIESNGKAIINTTFDFLWSWLVTQTSAYTSYQRQMINNSRQKAKFENDVRRSIIDAALFGSEGDIIYSALSIDETGLTSYGDTTVILKTASIENRTSVLETNSYFFIDWAITEGWTITKPLPTGYMAVWSDKHKLAAAKLEKNLSKGISVNELARLILSSNGDRTSDIFIELYIYGKIAKSVIEKIKIPVNTRHSSDYRKRLRLDEISKMISIHYY